MDCFICLEKVDPINNLKCNSNKCKIYIHNTCYIEFKEKNNQFAPCPYCKGEYFNKIECDTPTCLKYNFCIHKTKLINYLFDDTKPEYKVYNSLLQFLILNDIHSAFYLLKHPESYKSIFTYWYKKNLLYHTNINNCEITNIYNPFYQNQETIFKISQEKIYTLIFRTIYDKLITTETNIFNSINTQNAPPVYFPKLFELISEDCFYHSKIKLIDNNYTLTILFHTTDTDISNFLDYFDHFESVYNSRQELYTLNTTIVNNYIKKRFDYSVIPDDIPKDLLFNYTQFLNILFFFHVCYFDTDLIDEYIDLDFILTKIYTENLHKDFNTLDTFLKKQSINYNIKLEKISTLDIHYNSIVTLLLKTLTSEYFTLDNNIIFDELLIMLLYKTINIDVTFLFSCQNFYPIIKCSTSNLRKLLLNNKKITITQMTNKEIDTIILPDFQPRRIKKYKKIKKDLHHLVSLYLFRFVEKVLLIPENYEIDGDLIKIKDISYKSDDKNFNLFNVIYNKKTKMITDVEASFNTPTYKIYIFDLNTMVFIINPKVETEDTIYIPMFILNNISEKLPDLSNFIDMNNLNDNPEYKLIEDPITFNRYYKF